MYDAVGKPRQHIQCYILMGRENIAKVCAVEDVFQRWKYADPDRWSPVTWYKPDNCQYSGLR